EVHFLELHAAVVEELAWDEGEALGQSIGLFAAVSLDVADDNIPAGPEFALAGLEHGEGLAHSRAHAEKNLEPAARLLRSLALDRRQQGVRIWALRLSHESSLLIFLQDSPTIHRATS